MTRDAFHALLVHPHTGPMLHAMREDNARLDDRLQRERYEAIYVEAIRAWFAGESGPVRADTLDGAALPSSRVPRTRYAIQHTDPLRLTYWAGGNRWVIKTLAARWFDSMTDVVLAGLRDLPDPREAWRVVLIPDEAL
jgi:hypothetical protein